jgi:chaperonin GroES
MTMDAITEADATRARFSAMEIAGVSTKPVPHTPIGDRILVRPIPVSDKTEGGIIIPENAKEKPQRGIVVAVGPGRLLNDGTRALMQVKVGDVIAFAKYAGSAVYFDNEDLQVMGEHEAYLVEGR